MKLLTPVDMAHGRSFGHLHQFRNLCVAQLNDRAEEQAAAGFRAQALKGMQDTVVERLLVRRYLARFGLDRQEIERRGCIIRDLSEIRWIGGECFAGAGFLAMIQGAVPYHASKPPNRLRG